MRTRTEEGKEREERKGHWQIAVMAKDLHQAQCRN
jgi:hypothetical protein